jgi:hypothetical protein
MKLVSEKTWDQREVLVLSLKDHPRYIAASESARLASLAESASQAKWVQTVKTSEAAEVACSEVSQKITLGDSTPADLKSAQVALKAARQAEPLAWAALQEAASESKWQSNIFEKTTADCRGEVFATQRRVHAESVQHLFNSLGVLRDALAEQGEIWAIICQDYGVPRTSNYISLEGDTIYAIPALAKAALAELAYFLSRFQDGVWRQHCEKLMAVLEEGNE